MTGLIVATCLLAALPLLAAVILAGVVLERLTAHSEILVEEGVALERLGMELHATLNNLERTARQYRALGDPALQDLFSDRLREARSILATLDRRGFSALIDIDVQAVDQGLLGVARSWPITSDDDALEQLVTRFRALRRDAEAISASGGGAIETQITELRHASSSARQVMLLSAVALVPLSILLALGFSFAVARPLRKLSAAIRALGHSHYDEPIRLDYPREMRTLGEHLDWLRRRLAQLEADKGQFLRHVSHELKTPLASMREGVDLLQQGTLGPLSAQQLEVAEILRESNATLESHIHKLLAFARWSEGYRQAQASWFDPGMLIEDVLRIHKPPMLTRRVSAVVETGAPQLFGVHNQIRVALENLVANALRHAPWETTLEIRAFTGSGRCEIWVRDHGPGVPDRNKSRIFEPYISGRGDTVHHVPGSGLGLSIVKEIMLAHSGVVEVEDANPGTRFKLVWPCPEDGEAEHAA